MQASLLDLHCLANSGLKYGINQQPPESHKIKQHNRQATDAATPSVLPGNTTACAAARSDGSGAAHTPTSSQSATTQLDDSTAAATQLQEAVQTSLPANASDGCDTKSSGALSGALAQPATAATHEQSARRPDGSVPANCLDATVLAAALGFQPKAGCPALSSAFTPGKHVLAIS